MGDSSPNNQLNEDVQADYVDYLRSVLASFGPARGYISLNRTTSGRAKAIANQKNTEEAWDKAFGVAGAYQLFLDCIIASHHFDPMTLEVPDGLPINQVHIYRSLLAVDKARSAEDLPLPFPPKNWQGFYDRVRKVFVDVVISRLALDQLDHFIGALISNGKVSRVLSREDVDNIVRSYASIHPRYDGYYDLSDTESITKAIENKSLSIDLTRSDIRNAVRDAQKTLITPSFPSRPHLVSLIKEKMSSSNLNHLLENRWRTTQDLLAREGR